MKTSVMKKPNPNGETFYHTPDGHSSDVSRSGKTVKDRETPGPERVRRLARTDRRLSRAGLGSGSGRGGDWGNRWDSGKACTSVNSVVLVLLSFFA